MFNVITTIDFVACLCAIAALLVLIKGWDKKFTRLIKASIAALILLTLFHDVTNFFEWAGIQTILKHVESVEYYIEILVPVLWFLVLYFFLQEIMTHKLNEAMTRYKTLFEAAGESFIMLEFSSSGAPSLIDCNGATLKMFGFRSKEDLFGKNPEDLSPAIQANGISSHQCMKEIAKRTLEGESVSFEWQHLRVDGTSFDAEVSLNRIEVEDKPYLLAIVRDITGRKKIENLKNTLIRDVSHTLKSPLAVVKMACSMLKRGIESGDEEKTKKALNIAEENTVKAVKDVESILRMSSLDGSGPEGVGESISLKELFKELIQEVTGPITGKDLELIIDIPEEADKVFALTTDCKLLFENILENAYKFTDKGRVSVTSRVNGNFIDITVSDTGCGISSSHVDQVFDKFYKRNPAGSGIGLGLSICKEIVGRNEGSIEIVSEGEGKGTAARVSLPKG